MEARIFEFPNVRRGAPDVPIHLWDEVERCAATAESLASAGQEVRFTRSSDGGRVRAQLCAADGTILRPRSLVELLEFGDRPPPAAG